MEDVARRSGVGRATLYRRFPTKSALIDAVVLAEARHYLERSAQARAHATTFEDRMVYSTVFSVTFMREHTLLKKLIRTEPETILPSLAIDAGAILDYVTEHSAGLLRTESTARTRPRRPRSATDVVVHRHASHQHQPGHYRRHPRLRAQLFDADDHGTGTRHCERRCAIGNFVTVTISAIRQGWGSGFPRLSRPLPVAGFQANRQPGWRILG